MAIQAGKPTEKAPPRKLLVCAPSNAAIDEVAKRLRDGIRDSSGKTVIPKVVRIGNDASIHVSVKDIALDTLVTAKMNANGGKDKSSDASGEISNLRRELEEINRQRQEKLEALQAIQNNPTRTAGAETELKAINAKRSAVNQKLNQMRDQQTDNNRAMDAARRKFRQEVLWEADIICSTLSGSGHEILDQFDFETVVIDEAAQSIELSSLIPLKYQCKRCILVGGMSSTMWPLPILTACSVDPQQLAPTVLSMKASQKNYQQSLFVRIQKHRPDAVHLLRFVNVIQTDASSNLSPPIAFNIECILSSANYRAKSSMVADWTMAPAWLRRPPSHGIATCSYHHTDFLTFLRAWRWPRTLIQCPIRSKLPVPWPCTTD